MKSFSQRLLDWHRKHGRHDLPWQHPREPYRVWVAEVMLQQTTVSAVIPYFEKFMGRFPDVATLARADLDVVLAHWAGLGYYARARNLHRAAKLITTEKEGVFPEQFDDLIALPGVGRSTAGAVLAQAFGQRHPILDGNAKRLYARHAGVAGWPGKAAVQRLLWEASLNRTPEQELADYTQAVMDLGALVCKRRNPECDHCPVALDCIARQNKAQHEIPAAAPRRKRARKKTMMLICVEPGGKILLERRPPSGIWGGLYSLPEAESSADVHQTCQGLGLSADLLTELATVAHAFTHFDLEIHPRRIEVRRAAVLDAPEQAWYNLEQIADLGLPRPVQQILADLIR